MSLQGVRQFRRDRKVLSRLERVVRNLGYTLPNGVLPNNNTLRQQELALLENAIASMHPQDIIMHISSIKTIVSVQ